MARKFASQAEYYRHHGRCFRRALAAGITPREAELEIEREEAWERHKALLAKLELARNAPPPAAHPSEREEPWMMRD